MGNESRGTASSSPTIIIGASGHHGGSPPSPIDHFLGTIVWNRIMPKTTSKITIIVVIVRGVLSLSDPWTRIPRGSETKDSNVSRMILKYLDQDK